MNFDPELITQLLQSPALQSSSALASLASLLFDIRNYFAFKKDAKEKATIDDYLEWLRRQNHQQLVELVIENRDRFEVLFTEFENSIVDAIDRLEANTERRHREVFDYTVDANRIEIRPDPNGWHPENIFTIDGTAMDTKLRTTVTIVNRNHTNLTLTKMVATIACGSNKYTAEIPPTKQSIGPQGASISVTLITKKEVTWDKSVPCAFEDLALEIDQCQIPLRFTFENDRFIPNQDR